MVLGVGALGSAASAAVVALICTSVVAATGPVVRASAFCQPNLPPMSKDEV